VTVLEQVKFLFLDPGQEISLPDGRYYSANVKLLISALVSFIVQFSLSIAAVEEQPAEE